MARQFTPADHPIDGHRRELQQFSELSDGIEFRRVVVSQSRSWHLFPLSVSVHPHQLRALSFGNAVPLSSFSYADHRYSIDPTLERDCHILHLHGRLLLDLRIERNLLYLGYAKHRLSIIFFNLLISI
jgi:hypothetical protein